LLPALLLTGAARVDTARTEARPSALNRDLYWAYHGADGFSRRDTNPSGHVLAVWRLPRGLEVFGGAGHTVRIPDPQERYFGLKRMGSDWVGNPNLNPTRNTEADFGINYRAGRLTLRPTVFYSRLRDFIVVRMQPKLNPVPTVMNAGARSFENVDATMRGAELSWSVALRRSLLLAGGASYTRGEKRSGGYLPEMPPPKSRAALRYGARRFFAEVEALGSWRQDKVDAVLREERTPGYALLNFKAGIHSRRTNVAAGVDNLLNRYYYEHFSYQRDPFRTGTRVPETGRSVFITLGSRF
jgi:iron complex outermembrane recepter protein